MEILASRTLFRPADYQRSVSFYRDAIGLAIAREYGGGTVFYAGQSLIELAGHGAPTNPGGPFPGALWLQVRDLYATQDELQEPRRRDRPRGPSGTVGPARDARQRPRRRHADLRADPR